jgi:hypothetical protein
MRRTATTHPIRLLREKRANVHGAKRRPALVRLRPKDCPPKANTGHAQ